MLTSILTETITFSSLLLIMGLALVLGTLAALFYIKTTPTSKSFALTLCFLPLITATIILVVNGNLGAGIAVAGSFSLIRFRSAQGTGHEILALFLAAALGLTLGAGYIAIACMLLILYILFSLLLRTVHFGEDEERMRELRISVPESLDYEGLFDDLLEKYFTFSRLDRVKTAEMGSIYQLTYTVRPSETLSSRECLDQIRTRNGNLPVTLGRIPDKNVTM